MASHSPSLRPHAAAALLLISLLAACATRSAGLPEDNPAPSPDRLTLRVSNRGATDVIVYLVEGSVPVRLGRVPALKRAELEVPRRTRTGRPLQLLLRAAGSGRSYAPEPVWGKAGEVIELTLQPLLATSQLFVR